MEQKSYKELYQGGTGEIVEKKSRFIATVEKINNEEEAIAFLTKMRKKYYDARHNCFAYVAGKNQELQRCSDDGEPSGTAGRPMLDILLREDIHNVAVVVTRYFGGTLLGTGGLVHAYQKATQEGLADSIIIEKKQGRKMDIHTDYNGIGKIQYILSSKQIETLDTQYTDRVLVSVMVPVEQEKELVDEITNGTNGQAVFEIGDPVEYAMIDGELELF